MVQLYRRQANSTTDQAPQTTTLQLLQTNLATSPVPVTTSTLSTTTTKFVDTGVPTLASSSPPQSTSTSNSPNLLSIALLGTIGITIVLFGLLVILFCLRRGEKRKEVKKVSEFDDESPDHAATYLEGNTGEHNDSPGRPISRIVDVRRTSVVDEHGQIVLVDVVTYRAPEGQDSLPSYAEAVRGGTG